MKYVTQHVTEILMTVTVLSDLSLAEDGIVQLFRLCVYTVS